MPYFLCNDQSTDCHEFFRNYGNYNLQICEINQVQPALIAIFYPDPNYQMFPRNMLFSPTKSPIGSKKSLFIHTN